MKCRQCKAEIGLRLYCGPKCEQAGLPRLIGRYSDVSDDVPTCPGCGGRHYSAMVGDHHEWCGGIIDKGKGKGKI